jgi:hypothetical protein
VTTELREMTALDRRFVVPTWALGARWKGLTKQERFARVDRMLEAGARVVVLANDVTVHAWAAGQNGVLFYAYVPPELRGEGLARQVITKLLWGYPETIPITHPWPWASERFRFAHQPRMRTAA